MDYLHLTDLEVELYSLLTSLPLVAPSFFSTPIDTIISNLALLTSPLSLDQCAMLELGELLRNDASVLADVSLLKSKELTLVELFLE